MGEAPSVATLHDTRADSELREVGFTVVPLLEASQVEELREVWSDVAEPDDYGLTVDYLRPDRTAMKRIRDAARDVVEPVLDSVFVDHRVVMATFVTKHPGPASVMFLHDDRTFVDERRFRSHSAWIPLVDVDAAIPNGGLELIPRSHHLGVAWSGTGTPDVLRPYEAELSGLLEPVSVAAGDAVVYDSRVLHASGPNLGPTPRPALVCAVAPRSAELLHVVGDGDRRRLYHIDEEFFLKVHPHEVADVIDDHYPVMEHLEDVSDIDTDALGSLLGVDPESLRERGEASAPDRGAEADAVDRPKIGVAVITYEAASTIEGVLDGLPSQVDGTPLQVLVSDDASSDATSEIARRRQGVQSGIVEVVRHPRNLGNGGNQKACLRWADERGLDVLVFVHGDGQHPTHLIDQLTLPIIRGEADVVLGSRMMHRRDARAGGMPLTRYLGNRSLSSLQNLLAGTRYTEWYSGFRAYGLDAIRRLDLDRLPDGFDFDPAILLALGDAGARVAEVPVPTRYAGEISRVRLVRDGLRILGAALRHRVERSLPARRSAAGIANRSSIGKL